MKCITIASGAKLVMGEFSNAHNDHLHFKTSQKISAY